MGLSSCSLAREFLPDITSSQVLRSMNKAMTNRRVITAVGSNSSVWHPVEHIGASRRLGR